MAEKIDVVQRELAARELARRKLVAFIMRMFPGYKTGWFHKDLADRLERFYEAVLREESPRLILAVPPRHGKSLMASQYFPAWVLGKRPDLELIACSYSLSLASTFSRRVRETIDSPEYQALFDTKLAADERSIESWRTTKRGGYVAAGVGGPITGRGAHILVIDDPVKNAEEAESEADREAKKAWYQSTAYTRLAPGGGVIVIQTRWHSDDLAGWLEAQSATGEGDVFEVVKYPMVADENELYRRRGETLHPDRYDVTSAERIKKAVGPRVWNALYQQNPVPDTGSYFTNEMFHYYDDRPRRMRLYAAFDLAVSKAERADFTVGVVIGVDKQQDIYVLDIVRGRWDANEIVDQLIKVHKVYKPDAIGLEKGTIQLALKPFLDKRLREENIFDIHLKLLTPGKRDKESRGRNIQGRMKQGRVFWPRQASWLEHAQRELLQFPLGTHDDVPDALAYIGLMMTDMTAPPSHKRDKLASWRDNLDQFMTDSNTVKSYMGA